MLAKSFDSVFSREEQRVAAFQIIPSVLDDQLAQTFVQQRLRVATNELILNTSDQGFPETFPSTQQGRQARRCDSSVNR